jgi:hypothetical protein
VSVGHNEDSSAEVRRPDVGGRNCDGARSVSELAEVPPHRGQPGPHAARDVLDDDPRRPDLRDDPCKLEPEAGPLAADAFSGSGAADVLAWEASADEIDFGPMASFRDIVKPRDVGPMFREDGATERIDLALPDDRTEAGPFEAELQPTDSAEKRAHGNADHVLHPCPHA